MPLWACSQCTRTSNWARIKCLCGAAAPGKVVQAARKNEKEWGQQPAPSAPRAPKGRWANGAPPTADLVATITAAIEKKFDQKFNTLKDISKYNETDGHGLIGKFSMDGMDEARNNLHLMDCCRCHFVTAASLLAHAV